MQGRGTLRIGADGIKSLTNLHPLWSLHGAPTRHLSPSRASALRGVRVLRRGSDRNETGNKGRHESNAVRPIRRGRTVSREGGRSLSSGSSSAARCSQPDHRRLLAADPHEEPQNVRFPDPRSAIYGSARARFLWPKDGMTISLAEAVRLRFRLWSLTGITSPSIFRVKLKPLNEMRRDHG